MKLTNICKMFFLLFLLGISTCEIIRDEKFPTTAFTILDDHKTIELRNPLRQNAKLKFTFEGGDITRLEHKVVSSWLLHMHNSTKNAVSIRNITKATDKASHMTFTWWHMDKKLPDQDICFEMDYNNASWFSTFLEKDQPWPLNTGKPFPQARPLMTGSYGPNQLGPVVDNLFFNTDGFAIHFTSYYPSLIHRTAKQMCFTIKSAHEATDRTHFVSISFDVLAAENIQKVYMQCVEKFKFINRVLPFGAIPDARMFNQTIYNLDVKNLNQAKVIEQAKNIQKRGLKNVQLVLENWEAHLGDVSFDKTRFPDSKSLSAELHKLGFLVKLVVNSFVSDQSQLFKNFSKLLIRDPKDHKKPYTFNWTTHGHGAIFDFGLSEARYWFSEHLKDLHKYEGVDSFRFVGGDLGQFGTAETFPSLSHVEHVSNEFTGHLAQTAERLGTLVEVDAGYKSQYWPIFVRMRDIEADWGALKSVIPAAMTMSLADYSFINAPTFKVDSKPSEELYIRWLQLTTFLPSMQLSVAPWTVTEKAANLTAKFIALHLEHSQTIVNIAKHTSKVGEPLIRSLWYLAPDDSKTYAIADQFAVGNDIIVAPVLTQGQKERNVYLPTGTWIDQHGNSHSGPKEVKVLTPVEELPYFKRKL